MNAPSQKLLHRLARELYQVEAAAMSHSQREAFKLKDAPPGVAMNDVSRHASHVVASLPTLFEGRGVASLGLLGAATSFGYTALRRFGLDWVLGAERAYRLTLLEQRLGIDLVYELEQLAKEQGDQSLADWCEHWLEERVPLVTSVEKQLQWFVSHPDRALQGA